MKVLSTIAFVCFIWFVASSGEVKTGSVEHLLKLIDDKVENLNKDELNLRPMIGIMTQDVKNQAPYTTYIMAAYIKFVEAAGARAVPIRYNDTDEEILKTVSSLNGFLFPGGSMKLIEKDNNLTEYTRKGKLIYDYAKQQNDEGKYFPIVGTCLGFQELGVLEAPYADVLGHFSADDVADKLKFIGDPRKSKYFKSMDSNLLYEVQKLNITYNHHSRGISRDMFKKYKELDEAFKVTSVSFDTKGVEYVATMEHKKYPFYGTQYHPEKNTFIWKSDLKVPHSVEAIKLAEYSYNFFISEARKNMNRFPSPEEEGKHRVENWPVVFTSGASQDIYVF